MNKCTITGIMVISIIIVLLQAVVVSAEVTEYIVVGPPGDGYEDIVYRDGFCVYISDVENNKIEMIYADFNDYTDPWLSLTPIAYTEFEEAPTQMAISHNGNYLAAIFPLPKDSSNPSERGQIYILDASNLDVLNYIEVDRLPREICFSPEGDYIYVIGGLQRYENGIIKCYNVPELEIVYENECGPLPLDVVTDGCHVFVTTDIREKNRWDEGADYKWGTKLWVYDIDLTNDYEIGINPGGSQMGIAGSYLYIGLNDLEYAVEGQPEIIVFNTSTMEIENYIELKEGAGAFDIYSDGQYVGVTEYVAYIVYDSITEYESYSGEIGCDIWILENGSIKEHFDSLQYGLSKVFAVAIRNGDSVFALSLDSGHVFNVIKE